VEKRPGESLCRHVVISLRRSELPIRLATQWLTYAHRVKTLIAEGFNIEVRVLPELPRKLPISIARWGGTAWHPLGSHEPAFQFLTVVAPSGVPPAITRSRSNRYV
jgi:hypothetical protein